jgi:hypothetical protein
MNTYLSPTDLYISLLLGVGVPALPRQSKIIHTKIRYKFGWLRMSPTTFVDIVLRTICCYLKMNTATIFISSFCGLCPFNYQNYLISGHPLCS